MMGIGLVNRRHTMSAPVRRATIDDLHRVEGKAELINGMVVRYMASGRLPSRVAGKIYPRLDDYAESTGRGESYGDGMGFHIPEITSGRESFSPDVSYYFGPFPANDMRFIEGPPTFAVEVRSENDYRPAAELEIEAKRRDYFEAGTLVYWDVDPVARTIACYRRSAPTTLILFRRGDVAEAEPAVPG